MTSLRRCNSPGTYFDDWDGLLPTFSENRTGLKRTGVPYRITAVKLRHQESRDKEDAPHPPPPQTSKADTQEKEGILPERAEEAKLKAKYPSLGQKPGGSDFLMKRLQKGQKYFDSGDYNMAKAKMKNKQLPSAGPDKNLVTGDHIPTPQDLPQRKSSLVTSKLAGGQVE
ncbi:alpha-endosulfine [Pteronotus mesoamericanus]|uniref:alpha-endosulfine n=1 Tax=Pteronotus mesoamericanus TaxID=1884717 RepID=UPI0023EC89BD|nr:alpha-endosulfine [Pteronotus parnellii mesoamericanus]